MLVQDEHAELFHYTGSTGLAGIISGGTVWATHVHFLNDQEEYRLFFSDRLPKLLKAAVDQVFHLLPNQKRVMELADQLGGPEPAKKQWAEELLSYFQSGTRDLAEPYVVSFCTAGTQAIKAHGLLSQWRGYGRDGGYAVVFDTQRLSRLCEAESKRWTGMPMFLGDVEYYADPSVSEAAHPDTKAAEDEVQKGIGGFLLSRKAEDLEPIFDPAHKLACLTKHWGFAEENEVRLILSQPSAKIKALAPDRYETLKPIRTFQRDGAPVPYMALFEDIDGSKGRLPINRIIVGPHPDKLARQEAVQVLLDQNGYSVPVTVSGIPYRGR